MSDNYYEILEVNEKSTLEEIKKSYRRLSMLYHPDKNKNNPESTAKFQKISEAYENLSDPEKKRCYDMSRNNPFFNVGSSMGQNPIDELFAGLFSGMPFSHMQSFGQGTSFSHGTPFSQNPNIRIFHNGVQMNMSDFGQKPTPIIKNIIIPIDKIFTGTTIPLDIERWIMQEGNKIFEHETVYITIPKGIDEGEILILQEKGNIVNETCKGDIKIFIKIENNTDFKRNGLDLIYEKNISVKEALCGLSFELKYITGKMYTINNHSGNIINQGYNKIIPNMGFSRDQHTGNLILIFNVKFPEKLTNEIIEQLKSIDF
jgi:DnaJ-class molecular chaperone